MAQTSEVACDLASKKCVPCEGGTPPLEKERVEHLLNGLPGWSLDNGKLTREFSFKDFSGALEFVNSVGYLANLEGHHPDIELGWGRAGVTWWTHAINGLSENDFIMAAKVDELLRISE